MVTEEMIKRLPKVELHDHLDGGVRPATIIELAKKQNVELPTQDAGELAAWFHRGADRKSLALYLEGFATTLSVMQSEEALERIACETIEDLAADSVIYAEIRFAPMLHLGGKLNLESVRISRAHDRSSQETEIVIMQNLKHYLKRMQI